MRWSSAFATLVFSLCVGGVAHAQRLDVTFSTARTGGRYYPAHVLGVWVTSADGTFERTLHVWGSRRRSHLSEWNSTRPRTETLDGITSATLRTDVEQEVAWDLRDTTGALVPNGSYLLHFELADTNSTSANYRRQLPFEISPAGLDVTLEDSPILNVHIVYTPGSDLPPPPPAAVDAGLPKIIPVGRGYGERCAVGAPGAPTRGHAGWLFLGVAVVWARRRRRGPIA